MSEDEHLVFHVTSNFGHKTQKPFVMVTVGERDFTVQMSPTEARSLAMNLLSCADAAESDGFLITFLRTRVGLKDMRQIAAVLNDFREYRDAQRGED